MVSNVVFGFRQCKMPTTWLGSAGSAASDAAMSAGGGAAVVGVGAAGGGGGAPPQARLSAAAAPPSMARRDTVPTPSFSIIGPIYPYSGILASLDLARSLRSDGVRRTGARVEVPSR